MSKTNSNSSPSGPQGPQSPLRLGLYGGSFDPIHHGHLLLARDALEQLGLDRVIFIPAALSPHKTNTRPAPASARRELLQAALDGEERLQVDDCELRRPGISYTIDTVRHYREFHPGAQLFYFLGEDNLPELHTWKEIDALGQMVTFVILARLLNDDESAKVPGVASCGPFPLGQPGPSLLPGQKSVSPRLSRCVEISSSEIRNRVASGLSIRYMVPDSVMHIIFSRRLYVR